MNRFQITHLQALAFVRDFKNVFFFKLGHLDPFAKDDV